MSSKEVIKAAITKLDAECENHYKSANEAFYTSLGYALVSFSIFAVITIIPSKLITMEGFKTLIGIGGGSASSGISLSWGFKERLERRDKARQLEVIKKTLESLSESSTSKNSQEKNHTATATLDQATAANLDQVTTATLELILRTISAPYELSRTKAKRTE